MGVDAGFDMVPRLTKSAIDVRKWQVFIDLIKEAFQDDDRVEVNAKYIEFKAGEHPQLPLEGHKFLRFSSKISSRTGQEVEKYIHQVSSMASGFGSRVRRWTELREEYGYYSWKEVNESLGTYDQEDSFENSTSITRGYPGENDAEELERPCYTIEPIPDKGKGLVAKVNIPAGTRILAEKPLFSSKSSVGALDTVILAKVKALSKEEQRQYLSLHNNHPDQTPLSGIFRTNALPCGPESLVGAVYPTICLINHSCISNCHNNWNSATSTETIHSYRDIKAGEELTISYATGETSSPRLAKLKNAFGFDCTCELCSQPASDIRSSDTRRLEIQRLDEVIGDPSRTMNNPHRGIADCQKMLQLLQQEYGNFSILKARLYYDAFQISVIHSDQARASAFAGLAYKARILCDGEDSPETARMKSLMVNPAQHQSFGVSKRWRTQKGVVPKGLGEVEFEQWLWRRGSG